MYNILVCDDEKDIVNAIEIYLNMAGYKAIKAYNGDQAVELIRTHKIDLALLDVMMPVKDGITAMKEIRQISNIPVIILTAKSEDSDKILGLDSGADDYVTKPFNTIELLARVKSQLRRYTQLGAKVESANQIFIGSLQLNDNEKSVKLDGDYIKLTPTEYDILKLLMTNPNKVYSPKDIYENIWGELPYDAQNTVAVHIRHLREKIEVNPSDPRYIKVVWGQGYKLEN